MGCRLVVLYRPDVGQPVYDTNYSTLARWVGAGGPLKAPPQIPRKPMGILGEDGVERTSEMVMDVTDAPATGRLPIGGPPLRRVPEGRNVMDMLLGGLGISAGRPAGAPRSPPPRVLDWKNVRDVLLTRSVARPPAGGPSG